ncbi:MAG: Ig-like domain-containing protein [Gemmatimonadales bacterium]
MGRWTALRWVTLVSAAAACGGGDDLLLPGSAEPTTVTLVQGDQQNGPVGQPLPRPLVATVTDASGRPVQGATVVFVLSDPAPGASVSPDTVTTGGDGNASASVVLGTRPGPQTGTVEALGADGTTAAQAPFSLTAVPENANTISAVSGDSQSAPVGSALPAPLVVRVADAFGNPIEGVTVTWSVDGGGSTSEQSTTTGSDGLASVTRTLGDNAGTQHTLASVDGLAGSPVAFVSTATAGAASGVTAIGGNRQSGTVGAKLLQPLVVEVRDAQGNPVPAVAVTWVIGVGGGSIDPGTSTTDAAGHASATWTLGAAAGQNTVSAVVSGIGVAEFTATATAVPPAATTTTITSDQPDPSRVGDPVTVQVLVTSPAGTPTGTVTVQDGNDACPITLANGQGSCTLQLNTAGDRTLTASYAGTGDFAPSSDTKPHSVQPAPQPGLAIVQQPSSAATIGVAFATQPIIQLQMDGQSQALAGVQVTADIQDGGGSLTGTTTVTTDPSGRATFTDLAVTGDPGTRTLVFRASGYPEAISAPIDVQAAPSTGETARR